VQANNRIKVSRQLFIAVTLRRYSWQRQRDKESGCKRDAKHNEINVSADEKFEGAEKPALPINPADRQENLDCESRPEKSNNPSREPTWSDASQAHGGANDQHDRHEHERVNMQRVDQMIYVENMPPYIEDLEDEGEERDAAKHHVGKIVEEREQEQLSV
jgi:hypothetical protein